MPNSASRPRFDAGEWGVLVGVGIGRTVVAGVRVCIGNVVVIPVLVGGTLVP